jgi:hypothetical protein
MGIYCVPASLQTLEEAEMKTRFVTYEEEDDPRSGGHMMVVSNIIELTDIPSEKANRRRLMLQFGQLLDKMLEDTYPIVQIRVERISP